MKDKYKILGTVKTGFSGVNLEITNEGGAYDYCSMRTSQLSALTTIICGEGYETFKLHNDDIKGNVMWLINELAREIKQLLPIVCEEAKNHALAHASKLKKDKGVQHE